METLNTNLLVTLLNFAQSDVSASVQRLAVELSVSRTEVARGLNELAERGLVRPQAIRLTMMGLVMASSLRGQRHQARGAAA